METGMDLAEVEKLRREIEILNGQLEAMSRVADPGGFAKLVKKIAEAERALAQMNVGMARTDKEMRGLGQQAEGVSDGMQKVGKASGKASGEVVSGVAAQREALSGLREEYGQVAESVAAMAAGSAKDGLLAELEQIKGKLDEAAVSLNGAQEAQAGYTSGAVTLEAQVARTRERMELLASAGAANSEEYRQMQDELRLLGAAYGSVDERQQEVTGGASQWTGLIEGVKGLSSAVAVGDSVLGVFIQDNELLAEVQSRLQGVISVLSNAQQVSNTLQETGAFRTATFRKATELFSLAQTKLAVTLGISTVAAKALMATLTLGLSVALSGIVYLIDKWSSNQKKAAEEQKALADIQKRGVDGVTSQVVAYKQLQQQWNALGDDMEARKNFIEENRLEIDKLGVSVENVNDADSLFVENSRRFLEMLKLRALAMGAVEAASEKYKESLSARIEADALKKKHYTPEETENGKVTKPGRWDDGVALQKYNQLMVTSKDAERVAGDFLSEQMKIAGEISKTLGEIGGKGNKTSVREQIAALDAKIAQGEKDLEKSRAGDSKKSVDEIQAAVAKLKALKDARAVLVGDRSEKGAVEKAEKEISQLVLDGQLKLEAARLAVVKDGKEKRLAASKAEYEAQDREITRWFEDIKAKRAEQKKAPTAQESQLYEDRKTGNQAAWEQRDAAISEEYSRGSKERMKAMADMLVSEEARKIEAIEARYKKEKEWADGQLKAGEMTTDEHRTFSADAERVRENEKYKAMLGDLKDFQGQKEKLEADWKARIDAAGGDTDLVGRLTAGRDKALNELNGQMLMASAEWVRLFGNLDTLTISELDKLIGSIQSKLNSGDLKLNPIDLKSVLGKLSEAREVVATKSPFKGLGDSMSEMKKALGDLRQKEAEGLKGEALDEYKAKVENAAGNVKKAVGKVGESYGKVSGVMKDAAELIGMVDAGIGETVGNALALGDAVMNIGGVVAEAVTQFSAGMTAMEAASVVLLVIKAVLLAVTAAMSLFNGDKKHEKKIQNYAKEIKSLERAYEKLGKAIDKSYSSEKVALIDQQEENLKQQQVLLQQQIEEERKKKKTDNGKIDEWKNQIDTLNDEIAEMKERRIESIMGKDVQAALDDFAQAYVDAWASGEDRAKAMKDVVKDMIKGAVVEMIKMRMSPEVNKLMEYLASAVTDGITAQEQAVIDGMTNDIYRAGEAAASGYEQFLTGEKEEPTDGVSGQLQAALTEGTASQVLGAVNMMNIRTAEILQVNMEHRDVSRAGFVDVCGVLRESFEVQKRIEVNTAAAVSGLKEGFDRLDGRLVNIESNTKGYNGRG